MEYRITFSKLESTQSIGNGEQVVHNRNHVVKTKDLEKEIAYYTKEIGLTVLMVEKKISFGVYEQI